MLYCFVLHLRLVFRLRAWLKVETWNESGYSCRKATRMRETRKRPWTSFFFDDRSLTRHRTNRKRPNAPRGAPRSALVCHKFLKAAARTEQPFQKNRTKQATMQVSIHHGSSLNRLSLCCGEGDAAAVARRAADDGLVPLLRSPKVTNGSSSSSPTIEAK